MSESKLIVFISSQERNYFILIVLFTVDSDKTVNSGCEFCGCPGCQDNNNCSCKCELFIFLYFFIFYI